MVARSLFFLLICCPLTLFSQDLVKTGTVMGRLQDSATKTPLALATISVFSAVDTVLITYRMSNAAGEFTISGIPLNKPVRLVISYSGYAVTRQELTLLPAKIKDDRGTISMVPDRRSLEEVMVYAERPPVIVKKDTIEFNAASFKTLPSALVEDLLKKLPGVQLDGEGNITVNGKKVNRILVEGKEFFGGDIRMATRNLPANIIDKVQVTNDNDELEENPDKVKASVGQVINLKLKKGVKQGWFGKAYAGSGTDDRYEAGSIVNLFRDTLQVSVLGYSNNLNRPGFGFSDIRRLGGFDRSGISSIASNSNGGLSINGISFGGEGDGIQRSSGAGFNLNNVFKKNITLNTQYFYGESDNAISRLGNQQQFLGDTILTTRSQTGESLKTASHHIGFVLRAKTNPQTKLDFKPSLVFTGQHSHSVTDAATISNMKDTLNSNHNVGSVDGNNVGYNHTLSIARSYEKKGKSLNLYQVFNYNHSGTDEVNNAISLLYPSNTVLLDQLRKRNKFTWSVNTALTYNDPLSDRLRLRLVYTFNFLDNQDGLGTFDRNTTTNKYDIVNDPLTNTLERVGRTQKLSAAFIWNYKSLNVSGSLAAWQMDLVNDFTTLKQKSNQQYRYLFPGLAVEYKELSMDYSLTAIPPSITDLQPVPDNTNPLFIIQGNPLLKPAVSHNISFNFYKSLPEKSIFINAYLNGHISSNGVVRSRVVDSNGVQTSFPVNANDIESAYNQFNLKKQYRLRKGLQLSAAIGYYLNYYQSFLIVNDRKGFIRTVDLSPSLRVGINWKDKIEWNLEYDKGIYNTYYEKDQFSTLIVNRQEINTDIVIRWPKKWVWESSLDYKYNSATAPGIQKTTALLNAGVTFLFLKEDKGQLKLAIYDALNQNASVSRLSMDNYISNTEVNTLKRYLLLTFTYNIRDFKNKVGGKQSLFLF